jgi:hypothetical protein
MNLMSPFGGSFGLFGGFGSPFFNGLGNFNTAGGGSSVQVATLSIPPPQKKRQ